MKRPFALISSATAATCLLLFGSTTTTTMTSTTTPSGTTFAFSFVSSFTCTANHSRQRPRQLSKHRPLFSKTRLHVHGNNKHHNIGDSSLTDLLQQLDQHDIRYPPTASKQQLEQLLLSNRQKQQLLQQLLQHQQQHQQPLEEQTNIEDTLRVHLHESRNGRPNSDAQRQKNGLTKPTSISLNEDNVDSFARNGTRSLVESKPSPLPKDKQKKSVNGVQSSLSKEAYKPMEEKKPPHRRPISKILQQLDEAKLRYSPTATRQELEQMLQQYQKEQREVQQQRQNQQKPQIDIQEEQQLQLARRRRRRRMARKSTTTAAASTTASPWNRLLRKSRRHAQSLSQPVVDQAKRQARKMSRKVSDLLAVDENGIRDVEYTYLYKENIQKHLSSAQERPPVVVDVQVVSRKTIDEDDRGQDEDDLLSRVRPETTTTQSARSDWRAPPQASAVSASQSRQSRTLPRREAVGMSSSTRNSLPTDESVRFNQPQTPADSYEPLQPPLILPPIDSTINGSSRQSQEEQSSSAPDTNAKIPSSTRQRSNNRTPHSTKRRIYSPYSKGNKSSLHQPQEPLFNDNRDAFDRLGEFLADTADRVMWGSYDNDYRSDPGEKKKKKKTTTGEKKPRDSTFQKTGVNATFTERSAADKRHWKDRLEERLDYILGIHENGEYYNSWAKREGYERQHEGGFDPVSVAQGRQPKRSGVYPRRKTKYNKPIWEEEGNLVSLLFGRTRKGNSLLFEKLLDQDSGTLVNLFRSVFKSFLLVASYLCRWASVGGALPQPLVVLGLMTAGLCARKRLRAMVIALILLRTAGELAHGYLYGNDGWEEDDKDKEEEEKMSPPTQ